MGQQTKIEWCDHTFNPWIGCSKVHAGCAHCYAERDFDHRRHIAQWGPAGTRVVTGDAYWRKPHAWNRSAARDGVRRRVFCASLADVFEDRPELVDWRLGLFELIDSTPHLDWLLLTKRPENIREMWADAPIVPHSVGRPGESRTNVWLGTSISDQASADTQIPHLLGCGDLAPVLFVSAEPLLGPVDFHRIAERSDSPDSYEWRDAFGGLITDSPTHGRRVFETPGQKLNWVICGGESGPQARPIHKQWVRDIRDQCGEAGVPFLFKQWGEWLPTNAVDFYRGKDNIEFVQEHGRTGRKYPQAEGRNLLPSGLVTMFDLPDATKAELRKAEPWHTGTIKGPAWDEWSDLQQRIEKLPRESWGDLTEEARSSELAQRLFRASELCWVYRVGKAVAGRLLDGREWSQFPLAHITQPTTQPLAECRTP